MVFQKDFHDLCALLNEENVDYLIVGAYAVAFHGAPRATGDFDILIHPESEHVARLLRAVKRFGFPSEEVTPEDLLARSKILQLGRSPVQIHIMTSISGVSWEDAWKSRESAMYSGLPVLVIGRSALLANKTAAGRAKDVADVEALRRKGISG